MPKVLISDKLSQTARAIFSERGVEADYKPGLSPSDLAEIIGDYDGLAIRSATKVTAELLAKAKVLKVIGRAGIGVDNVDREAATQSGVIVMNTPFGNAITTAEHTIAMMMACARQIPLANASTHQGLWEKSKFMGVELFGKTLGLIGAGNIGAIVAERAIGLKMRVIAYDPYLSKERAKTIGITQVSFEDLLARSDFITVHTPLTASTKNILNADAFAKTKQGVRIINCARGGIVDEDALKAALDAGKVAGAALDVFATEPARENSLFGRDDVVATPHLGASTQEAQENVAIQVAEQMADYLLTGAITNALNMPSVSADEAPRLKPYMKLAEQMGAFAGQVTEHGVKKISFEFEGQVAKLNVKPLIQAALAGFMGAFSDAVNMVNAPSIARQRGIDVSETIHDRPNDYQTMIRLTIETDQRSRALAGTLFAGVHPRIVDIKGIAIEAELSEHMLYITNQDKPGLIGNLGRILGDNGVNIASFNLGREAQGESAIALLELDEALPDHVLSEIKAIPFVIQAIPLRF